jgi:hypothetical protein
MVRIYLMDLRNGCSQKLRGQGLESHTLLGVRGEAFGLKNLKFSIFFDKGHDVDKIAVDSGAIAGREQDCDLRGRYTLRSETKRQCKEGQTWVTTFPGASITSWKVTWEIVGINQLRV